MIALAGRRPVAVCTIAAAIALLGAVSWRRMPVALATHVELPGVDVTAVLPAASPELTEARLTSAIEAAAQQVRGVARVSSTSHANGDVGIARVEVRFGRGVNVGYARAELAERLAVLREGLPRGVRGPYVSEHVPEELAGRRLPFLTFAVAGPLDTDSLAALAERVLLPRLRAVEGVAEARVEGTREPRLVVGLDPARSAAARVHPRTVRSALGALDVSVDAGVVLAGSTRMPVTVRVASTAQDVGDAALPGVAGPHRARDVARVGPLPADEGSRYRVDGMPAVTVALLRSPRTDPRVVAAAVKAGVEPLRAVLAPSGVRVLLDADETTAIEAQLAHLRHRGSQGAVALVVLLVVALGTWRAAVVVLAAAAVAALATVALAHAAGHALDGATRVGLLVGAVLAVDQAASLVLATRSASGSVRTVVGGAVVMLLALSPFLRAGLAPATSQAWAASTIALTIALTVAVGAACSVMVVPALLGRRAHARTSAPRIARAAARMHARAVARTLRRPRATLSVASLLVLAALAWSARRIVAVGPVDPTSRGDALGVRVDAPGGASLDFVDGVVRRFERLARDAPAAAGVDRTVASVSPTSARLDVTFTGAALRTAAPGVLRERLAAEAGRVGGARVRVVGLGGSLAAGGAPAPTYAIEVSGYDYERVRALAVDVGERLRRHGRVRDVDVDAVARSGGRPPVTEVVVRLDRDRLARHGVGVRDALDAITAASAGADAGSERIRLDGAPVGVSVRLAGHERLDARGLARILVSAEAGAVRLEDVGAVAERRVPARITRVDQQYRRLVTYEFLGSPRLGARVLRSIVGSTHVQPGYAVAPVGEAAWSGSDRAQSILRGAAAATLAFLACAALFESSRSAACVVLVLPAALAGTLALVAVDGGGVTRELVVGAVAAGGIVVKGAIDLVDRMERARRGRRGPAAAARAALVGSVRGAPALLLAACIPVAGLSPPLLAGAGSGIDPWRDVALTIVGAVAGAAAFLLVGMPALYVLLAGGVRARGRGALCITQGAV